MARDCQVGLSTVRGYYSILEDTLIGFFLFPFANNPRKRINHQPKFYFFDNGVTRALLGTLKEHPTMTQKGHLFEQWVLQELVRKNDYEQKDWKLNFWRTSHGAEVDIVISRGAKPLYAIECKSTRQVSNKDLSGFKSFREVYPKVPCFIVTPSDHQAKVGFARTLPPLKLFAELR